MAAPKDDVRFLLSAELFPIVYKDVESGIYVAEILAPPSDEASRHAQVLVDSNTLDAMQSTDLRLIQRMAYWAGPGTVLTLNPAFAFAEQLVSNPDNAEEKMKDWTGKLSPFGLFPSDYASTMYPYMRALERDIREQVGTLFCYLALFEFWATELRSSEDALQRWIDLFQKDIPRLKILYFLGGLFAISVRDESLRIRGTNDSVAAWRQAVCSDRTKEKGDYARRLRNRAFDIVYFMFAPVLTHSSGGGYSSRVLLATEDQFVGEFLCRTFQWMDTQEGNLWRFRFADELFVSKRGNGSLDAIQLLIRNEPEARQYRGTPGEREAKLKRLADLTLEMLPQARAGELRSALVAFAYPL